METNEGKVSMRLSVAIATMVITITMVIATVTSLTIIAALTLTIIATLTALTALIVLTALTIPIPLIQSILQSKRHGIEVVMPFSLERMDKISKVINPLRHPPYFPSLLNQTRCTQ